MIQNWNGNVIETVIHRADVAIRPDKDGVTDHHITIDTISFSDISSSA